MKPSIQFPPNGDFYKAGMIAYRHKRTWPELAATFGKKQLTLTFDGSNTGYIPVIFPSGLTMISFSEVLRDEHDRAELYLGLGLQALLTHVIPDIPQQELLKVAFRPNLMQAVNLIGLFAEGN